jgi:hypothetical protein
MARRGDYRGREPKKAKKDSRKKNLTTSVIPTSMPVEVIRKERKKKEEEEED